MDKSLVKENDLDEGILMYISLNITIINHYHYLFLFIFIIISR